MNKPLARIGQRFTSQFVDGLVAMAVGVVFYFIAKAFGFPNEWIFVGWLLYILLCDGLPGGQSMGKRFTKTSVVHVRTELPCTYWQSCVRNFTMVLGVVDAAFIAGKQRRRLGDLLAGTKVIQLLGCK
jgi:uncharacterized RDD family membrane protein YckC